MQLYGKHHRHASWRSHDRHSATSTVAVQRQLPNWIGMSLPLASTTAWKHQVDDVTPRCSCCSASVQRINQGTTIVHSSLWKRPFTAMLTCISSCTVPHARRLKPSRGSTQARQCLHGVESTPSRIARTGYHPVFRITPYHHSHPPHTFAALPRPSVIHPSDALPTRRMYFSR